MDDSIRKLLKLHQVDLDILELERAASAHPKRLAEIDAELGAQRARSDALQVELEELEAQTASIASSIQEQRDQAKKWEGRLNDIKTPREYAALSREIDIAKKGIKNLEEEKSGLAEQVSAINSEIEKTERKLLDMEQGFAPERAELDAAIGAQEEAKAALMARRKEATAQVDRALLGQYNLIRSKRDGIALAEAQEGGTCGGCRMRLQPQVYNDLLVGRPGVRRCDSCQRIVYVPERSDDDEAAAQAGGA